MTDNSNFDEYPQQDLTADEQTDASVDSSQDAEPIEVAPFPAPELSDGAPVFDEPAAPELEAPRPEPLPDAQGVISLDAVSNFIVACDTPGCENEGIEINVVAVTDDPIVQCGPCGELITDVRPA